MLKIGLTGGIGSGKSTVARVFATLGVPVYDADKEAKRIMNTDPVLRKEIEKEFGEKAYAEGQLDRAYLASVVFSDPEKIKKLNALVHPVTIADADRWMQSLHSPYAIKEAALLFESGADKHLDYVIGVTAPEDLRIARVMERDQVSEEDVRKRISNQMADAVKMKKCDYIIRNDEKSMILPQILDLHKNFSTRI